jgi:cellulose synthase/poly-beta-1,6-N-acetylglucosamine synthase-like glycosyltransferase
MSALAVVGLVAALLLTIPAAILLVECVAALLPAPPAPPPSGLTPRVALLIPAHDEELGIGATVKALVAQLAAGPAPGQSRLIVVADNCSDETAVRARAAGAQQGPAGTQVRVEVIERRDPEKRGKGYAIEFGLHHLDADPPDVVVLVDADCRLDPGSVGRLAMRALGSGRPVQGEYLLHAAAGATPVGAVSALAILVRNRVRPRGLYRLGLPCQLTGSGMAFPWRVLRDAPATGANLVEDLVMGLEMAKRGQPPLLAPDVQVSSELPGADSAARKQRRRWEHGQLHTLVNHGLPLVLTGLTRARLSLMALGLDLLVPPLAMLVVLEGGALAVLAGAALFGWLPWTPAFVVAGALGAVALAVVLGWLKYGRATIPARTLVMVPLYVLWKIPLYLSLLLGGKQRTWERTDRQP